MSWGFLTVAPPDTLLTSAIDYAANDRDCVLVASVGNHGSSTQIAWPARYSDVLAVGAVHRVGTLDSLIHSSYSNFISNENAVDVVGPVDLTPEGVWVDDYTYTDCSVACPCQTTVITGWSKQGTSFAAPQAAGIAALIRARFPALDQSQVRARIKRGAEYYWAANATPRYGAGKVNAYRSLTEWGTITANTTWGATTGMPDTMYVSGDLTIASGVTLTLNRGTVVRVAGGDILASGDDPGRVEIVVEGQLAIGTAGSGEIIFESFTDGVPTDGDWVGIRFDTTQTVPLTDVVVMTAQVGIEVSSGSVTLESVTAQDCQTGVEISGGSGSLRLCILEDNSVYGLRAADASASVAIEQSTVDSNDVGIYLADNATATIDSCTIELNDVGIEVYNDSLVTVRDCSVVDNTTDGIYAHTSAHILVEGCDIEDNAVGILAYDCRPLIKNSNVISGNPSGIKCDTNAHAVVESTTVVSGTVGISALNGSDPDIGHATGGLSVGHNIIHSHSSHHVVNLTPSVTVMAENNWWNATGGPKASKFSGAVDYTPWLSSAPSLAPVRWGGGATDDGAGPGLLRLSPNYPNPFNPTTRIEIEVPQAGSDLRLEIYDVAGRHVKTVAVGQFPGGTHQFRWDGRDDAGRQVASGVYLLRLSAPGRHITRKLVLLK
jgi:parallel beta-helix repeat protein